MPLTTATLHLCIALILTLIDDEMPKKYSWNYRMIFADYTWRLRLQIHANFWQSKIY